MRDYSDMNTRIHEHVKLCSFASSIRVDLTHLHRLQNDADSIQLSFNLDATLQLAKYEANNKPVSFELIDSRWKDAVHRAVSVKERFRIIESFSRRYLLKRRQYYAPFDCDSNVDDQKRRPIDSFSKSAPSTEGTGFLYSPLHRMEISPISPYDYFPL